MGNKHRLFSRSNFVSPTPEKSCNKPSPLSAPPSVKRLIPSLSTFNLPPCHPITPFDSGRSIDNPPPVFACDELNIPKGHFVLSDLPTGSGIRPIQLLLERLDAWHTLARRLYEYFQMLAQVEAQVAKAYHRLDGLLAFSGEKQNGKHPLLYTHFAVQDRGHTGIQLVCDSWQAYYSDNAKDHDEFGNFLRTHALPTLSNIKRELKWMTRTIRSDDRLTLSTLAKLRDEASKRIQRLDAQLSFFDQHPHHVYTKQDPWIINAAVIKQIIKVYQQENKIHETVLRLQHETRVSEEHLMEELQQLFRQIYSMREHNILGLDKGIQRMMDVFEQAKPGADWQSFAERAKGHLISENAAFRHPDQLHYPNQSHPLLQPLFAARMERKSTVLHQWHEYMYVLTPAGFLHEYRTARAYPTMPSTSIYIPHYTVSSPPTNFHHNLVFELEPHHQIAQQLQNSMSSLVSSWASSRSFRKRQKKAVILRAKSACDLQIWLEHFNELANRFSCLSYGALSPVNSTATPTCSPLPPIHLSQVVPEPVAPDSTQIAPGLDTDNQEAPLPDASNTMSPKPTATAVSNIAALSDCPSPITASETISTKQDGNDSISTVTTAEITLRTEDGTTVHEISTPNKLTGVCYS